MLEQREEAAIAAECVCGRMSIRICSPVQLLGLHQQDPSPAKITGRFRIAAGKVALKVAP